MCLCTNLSQNQWWLNKATWGTIIAKRNTSKSALWPYHHPHHGLFIFAAGPQPHRRCGCCRRRVLSDPPVGLWEWHVYLCVAANVPFVYHPQRCSCRYVMSPQLNIHPLLFILLPSHPHACGIYRINLLINSLSRCIKFDRQWLFNYYNECLRMWPVYTQSTVSWNCCETHSTCGSHCPNLFWR